MSGDPTSDDAAPAADSDGDPPSSQGIVLLDRRAPGSPASAIPLDFDLLHGHVARLVALVDRPVEVTVALLDDAGMDLLHQEHSGVAGTTDVLSFQEDGSDEGDHGAPVVGDLAVGVEVAAREATERGRAIEAELLLYIVHGLLHLTGERDHDVASRRRMIAAQDGLLEQLGLPRSDEQAETPMPGSSDPVRNVPPMATPGGDR